MSLLSFYVVVGDSGCLETVDPPLLGAERGMFIVPAVIGIMRRTALFRHYGAARKTRLHRTRGLSRLSFQTCHLSLSTIN